MVYKSEKKNIRVLRNNCIESYEKNSKDNRSTDNQQISFFVERQYDRNAFRSFHC